MTHVDHRIVLESHVNLILCDPRVRGSEKVKGKDTTSNLPAVMEFWATARLLSVIMSDGQVTQRKTRRVNASTVN